MLAQAQQFAGLPADVAAHLQRRALAPGAAAGEVREHSADEDGREQQQGHRLAVLHGVDDVVGVHAFGPGEFIQRDDGKARKRQQVEEPCVRAAQLGGFIDREMESGAHRPAQPADHGRHEQPACQRARDARDVLGGFLQ